MKRIAFVINSIHLGGPSYVLRSIIRNLDRSTYEIHLITLFDSENTPEVIEELVNQGVKIHELHVSGRREALLNTQHSFNDIVSSNQICIIHSHGFIPDILSARCKCRGIKKISTIHNNLYTEYPEVYGNRKATVLIPFHIHYLKRLDYCACCSQFVYDSMEKALHNLTVVRNGIDHTVPKKPVYRSDLGIPESAVLYIYVGQLRARKNIIWLINQFKKYHRENEYLLVLGRGADKAECEKILDPNIIHYGFTDNPYAFMQISDVYISAALAEGFSISVLEAMDNGLALFLSDIPAHTEAFKVARDTCIGRCFRSNDIEDFERQLDIFRGEFAHINKDEIKRITNLEMSAVKMANQYSDLYVL